MSFQLNKIISTIVWLKKKQRGTIRLKIQDLFSKTNDDFVGEFLILKKKNLET